MRFCYTHTYARIQSYSLHLDIHIYIRVLIHVFNTHIIHVYIHTFTGVTVAALKYSTIGDLLKQRTVEGPTVASCQKELEDFMEKTDPHMVAVGHDMLERLKAQIHRDAYESARVRVREGLGLPVVLPLPQAAAAAVASSSVASSPSSRCCQA